GRRSSRAVAAALWSAPPWGFPASARSRGRAVPRRAPRATTRATRLKDTDASSSSSACPGAVGHRPLRHRQRRHEAVGIADVEQHPLRHLAGHLLRLEIDDEQRLLADQLLQVLALLFHARKDRSRVIAEADGEPNQLA